MKSLLPLLILFPLKSGADLTIFDTRKNLALSENEPVYHDYYVNGGSEAGLNAGMVITVTRKLPLYDSYQNHSAGDLLLKVAKVRIIHTQKGLAVARKINDFTRDNAPLMEDPFIMVGDNLDLSTATSEGNKKGVASTQDAQPEAAPADGKPVAQITVNAVSITSTPAPANPASAAAKAASAKPSTSVDAPKLQ